MTQNRQLRQATTVRAESQRLRGRLRSLCSLRRLALKKDNNSRSGSLVVQLGVDQFHAAQVDQFQSARIMEILDDRYNLNSTIVTSQLEPKEWHAVIGDPTLADAICDRLVHNAHRIKLAPSESIRKTEGLTTKPKPTK